jgi:transcriptional regulator
MPTSDAFAAAVRKGSGELVILSTIEDGARHGYEIAKLVEERSNGVLQFRVASFYPLLYGLERRGLIKGRWVEKEGQRRRRYYTLTPAGRRVLTSQRSQWEAFTAALTQVARLRRA